MGTFPGIGDWSEQQLDNWLRQRIDIHLPGNVQNLIQQALVGSVVPAGHIGFTARTAAPDGWLAADGSTVLIADQPALSDAIGTTYNTGGEAAGEFRLPDLRGRTIFGQGTHADVNALTDNDGVAVASRTPKHAHHKATFNVGAKIDSSLAGSGDNVAAGGAFTVTDDTFYAGHVHAVPAFDTDTANAPYAVGLAVIKT